MQRGLKLTLWETGQWRQLLMVNAARKVGDIRWTVLRVHIGRKGTIESLLIMSIDLIGTTPPTVCSGSSKERLGIDDR